MSARAATGNLYEELYARHNYHGFSRFTTGATVARVVTQDLKRFATNHGVLDVGCSHGRLVQLMWVGGVKASGVDVSAAKPRCSVSKAKPCPVIQNGCARRICVDCETLIVFVYSASLWTVDWLYLNDCNDWVKKKKRW